MNRRIFWISVLLLLAFSLSAEKITFSADSMSGSAKNDGSRTLLQGEAYILTQSMEIFSDRIELSGDDYRNIKAEGNVKGKNFDSGLEFTCGSLEYDRTTKIALLKGDVSLTDSENGVSAKAQVIEYNSDTDIAVLQIGVNLTQKDNVCSSSYAVYHKKQQMLNLSGNAKIKQKEDTFRAQHITLNMETEEITLDGRVKGSVTEKADEPAAPEASSEKGEENSEESFDQDMNEDLSEAEDTMKDEMLFSEEPDRPDDSMKENRDE